MIDHLLSSHRNVAYCFPLAESPLQFYGGGGTVISELRHKHLTITRGILARQWHLHSETCQDRNMHCKVLLSTDSFLAKLGPSILTPALSSIAAIVCSYSQLLHNLLLNNNRTVSFCFSYSTSKFH
jgi:hypothetical protein